ncbi:hypothetical protein AAX06_06075 [Moraxella bovoculi]|uniref:Uncharacterized protein n=1 Tax=Moraxella bovoculi TaxID=386891 RepID=A0AAC8PVJ7_9GAMM|nr:hypothetical protein [Moraxella bovoculi]AKG07795.1 hypothetical protein AAX06_06075 [Moraxella bovoculi]AKG11525.1 hypothetical protein AAX07_05445 [Moraxella bovoculi]
MTVNAQDIQWVRNEYLAGRTIDEISIDTGKSVKTIKRYLAEAGVLNLSWHKTKEENNILKYLKSKNITKLYQLVDKL